MTKQDRNLGTGWQVKHSVAAFLAKGWNRKGIQLSREDLWEICDVQSASLETTSTKDWLRLNSRFASRRVSLIKSLHIDHQIALVYDGASGCYTILKDSEVAEYTLRRMEKADEKATEQASQLLSAVGGEGLNLKQKQELAAVRELVLRRKKNV